MNCVPMRSNRSDDRDRRAHAREVSRRHTDKAELPPERFQILVDCRDERTQKHLYERLSADGFICRVLVM